MSRPISTLPAPQKAKAHVHWYEAGITIALGLLLAWVWGLLLFASGTMSYSCKRTFALADPRLLLLGIAWTALGCAIGYALVRAKRKLLPKKGRLGTVITWFSVPLFVVQLYISWNIFFLTDWDPGVLRVIATDLSVGNPVMGWFASYLQYYPNNMLYTLLESYLFQWNTQFGLFPAGYAEMALVVLNALVLNVTCLMIFRMLQKLVGDGFALAGYGAAVALLGLSPWMVIPYTDVLGLFFPTAMLYVCVMGGGAPLKWYRWVLIIVLAAVGYLVKPQCLISYIALMLLSLLRDLHWKGLLRTVCVLAATLVLLGGCSQRLDDIAYDAWLDIVPEAKLDWPHFLMMGLNEESNGVYSAADSEFSQSFETRAERNQADLAESLARVKAFGFGGLATHWSRKLLTTFNDGTFAWGQEGTFYAQVLAEPNEEAAPALRALYYSTGEDHERLAVPMQTLWLCLLLFTFVSLLFRPREELRTSVYLMRLTLLGLILFELLFEARARYLFIYAPVFILLAVLGLKDCCTAVERLLRKGMARLRQRKGDAAAPVAE